MKGSLQQHLQFDVDISEDDLLRDYPEAFALLFKDHTTSPKGGQTNIFWATNDYEELGEGYEYNSPILPELITGVHGNVLMPRVLKDKETQRERVKEKAEVFTPSWICNTQNNLIDEAWFGRKDVFNHERDDHTWETITDSIEFPKGKTWKDYVRDTRMEITCGEAPYLVSRYDTTTGRPISLGERIGLLDRKLRVVSENTEDSGDWLDWAKNALRSTYGYEWQGDSLFLARESMFVTFIENYIAKFDEEKFWQIKDTTMPGVAYIVSWNLWQMDGLKGVVPNSCGVKPSEDRDLFTGAGEMKPCQGCIDGNIKAHNGIYCLIKDWKAKDKEKQKIKYIDLINPQR